MSLETIVYKINKPTSKRAMMRWPSWYTFMNSMDGQLISLPTLAINYSRSQKKYFTSVTIASQGQYGTAYNYNLAMWWLTQHDNMENALVVVRPKRKYSVACVRSAIEDIGCEYEYVATQERNGIILKRDIRLALVVKRNKIAHMKKTGLVYVVGEKKKMKKRKKKRFYSEPF